LQKKFCLFPRARFEAAFGFFQVWASTSYPFDPFVEELVGGLGEEALLGGKERDEKKKSFRIPKKSQNAYFPLPLNLR
jgi:hypothetical protein